jgi:hypothetical protein
VDHGFLRPDLDVAATADDITGMLLAAVIGSSGRVTTATPARGSATRAAGDPSRPISLGSPRAARA